MFRVKLPGLHEFFHKHDVRVTITRFLLNSLQCFAAGCRGWQKFAPDYRAAHRVRVLGLPPAVDRGGALPPDRMVAAREILDWNGYDLARMQVWN